MKLNESNTWIIISLIFTTIIAPYVVWNLQQGKIENLKLEIEKEKLSIEKQEKSVAMFEKLSALLAEQRQNYDAYTALIHKGHSLGSFDLQRERLKMEEKDQEINNVKSTISKLTGKNMEHIKGTLPPLPPSGLKIIN